MTNNIQEILDGFSKLNVLIVGDVMIDRYLHGKVNRISPEAPVPVVELQKTEDRLGGAANVALNIKALGATPYLYSVIGADTEGDAFVKLMQNVNLSTKGIMQSKDRKTTIKTRVMAGAQQMLRIDSEITHDINIAEQKAFLKSIQELIEVKNIHVIIFQDYNKGVLCLKTIRDVSLEALKENIPTVVDPKKSNFMEYKHASLFKPNLKEIREAVPFEVKPNIESLKKAANHLRLHIGQKSTMITLSEKGIYFESDTDSADSIGDIYPTKSRNIADVSGAGDTVVSIAALGLASNLDKKLIAVLSNIAGGQVCEKVGVVPVDIKQLEAELKNELFKA